MPGSSSGLVGPSYSQTTSGWGSRRRLAGRESKRLMVSVVARMVRPQLADSLKQQAAQNAPELVMPHIRVSPSSQMLQVAHQVADDGPSISSQNGIDNTPKAPLHHNKNARAQSAREQEQNLRLVDEALGGSSQLWRPELRNSPGSSSSIPKDLLSNPDKYPPYEIARNIGYLAKAGQFSAALKLIEEITQLNRVDVLNMISRRYFLQYAKIHKQSKAAVALLHVLPKRFLDLRDYNGVLQVCAEARDLESGLEVMELLDKNRLKADTKLLTSLIKVCKSVGNADKALKVFADMKARNLQLDAHVYGALVSAFAEAMQRELNVVHERKEQYVLLERAMQILLDAEASNVRLGVTPWNSLVLCAARCGQLKRVFDVLEMMRDRGLAPDAVTYGTLMEACVLCNRPDVALRVFNKALSEGFTRSVEIYTVALSACKMDGAVNLERAYEIYNVMQRNNVEPDKKFFSALIAVAGKAGRLDLAFETLQDMSSAGISPGSTIMSGVVHACLLHGDLASARRAYDHGMQHGVSLAVSQYNRMLDWYAADHRFGDVVSLVNDMVRAGRAPNLNTYRTIINACQRAAQPQLAMEVYAVMRSKKIPILQEKFAQTIYFTLIKSCFNQMRALWPDASSPWRPKYKVTKAGERLAEAESILRALASADGPAGVSGSRLSSPANLGRTLAMPPDSINWAQNAIGVYRDMVLAGHRPTLDALDRLMGCLRLRLDQFVVPDFEDGQWHEGLAPLQVAATTPAAMAAAAAAGGRVSREQLMELQDAQPAAPVNRIEMAFDRRALSVLEDAMSRGHIASIKGVEEGPLTLDLRTYPPMLAEVMVLGVLSALDKRVAKTGRTQFLHTVTFLVPPFDPDFIMWPTYVEKLNKHYSEQDVESESPSDSQSSWEEWAIGSRDGDDEAAASNGAQLDSHALDEDEEGEEGGAMGLGDLDMESTQQQQQRAAAAAAAAAASKAANRSVTGLAVAATCRRMKVFAALEPSKGVVTLTANSITSWIINKQRMDSRSAPAPSNDAYQGQRTAPSRMPAPPALGVTPATPAQRQQQAPGAPAVPAPNGIPPAPTPFGAPGAPGQGPKPSFLGHGSPGQHHVSSYGPIEPANTSFRPPSSNGSGTPSQQR